MHTCMQLKPVSTSLMPNSSCKLHKFAGMLTTSEHNKHPELRVATTGKRRAAGTAFYYDEQRHSGVFKDAALSLKITVAGHAGSWRWLI